MKDPLSIYSAILATVVFLRQIYEFWAKNSNRLKIEFEQKNSMIISNNQMLPNTIQCFFEIKITNIGYQPLHIIKPVLLGHPDPKNRKAFTLFDQSRIENYPKTIQPGEYCLECYDYDGFIEHFQEFNFKQVKILVTDTRGKRYNSKWFDVL